MSGSPDDGPADYFVIDVARYLGLPPDQWSTGVKLIVCECFGVGWSPLGTAYKVRRYLAVDGGTEHGG